MVVGIICEYNPFHLGHLHQIQRIRQVYGEDTSIVCAMSGNFVQRGEPALFDKSIRAEAAVACGADLVVELPVTAALSSAGSPRAVRRSCPKSVTLSALERKPAKRQPCWKLPGRFWTIAFPRCFTMPWIPASPSPPPGPQP